MTGSPSADFESYNRETKCCTYEPSLANFQVGQILANHLPGESRIRQRISARSGVTPLGIAAPASYTLLYRRTADFAFGRATALRCSFYHEAGQEGTCGIWEARNSVCRAWHCKHERGRVGKQYWSSLQSLLQSFERAVALWCVLEHGLNTSSRADVAGAGNEERMLRDELIGVSVRSDEWAHWRAREHAFYESCWNRATSLSLEDILGLAGVEGRSMANQLRRRFEELVRPSLPLTLRFKAATMVSLPNDQIAISTYSKTDPLIIPGILAAVLPAFDGRAYPVVVEQVEASHGIQITIDLIQKLFDFGLLTATDGATDHA